MKDIKQLNEVFTHCFLKGWKNITWEERNDISDRRRRLDKSFEFTDEVILQLRKLNHLLAKEQDRICMHEKVLIEKLGKWVDKKIISDYEINWEIQCWNEKYYKQWNEEFDGNPFFSTWYILLDEAEEDNADPTVDKRTDTILLQAKSSQDITGMIWVRGILWEKIFIVI